MYLGLEHGWAFSLRISEQELKLFLPSKFLASVGIPLLIPNNRLEYGICKGRGSNPMSSEAASRHKVLRFN
jgi:hypothetical protein